MDIAHAQRMILRLNTDFATIATRERMEIENSLGLASGEIVYARDGASARRAVRQMLLEEVAACEAYLAPTAAFPPEAVGSTTEDMTAAQRDFEALIAALRTDV